MRRQTKTAHRPVGPVLRARQSLDLTASLRVGPLTAALVRLSCRRPVVTIAVSALIAVAASVYTVHALAFVTSPVKLLPQRARYVLLMKEYLKDFGALQGIVVAVQAPTPAVAKEYAGRLAGELRQSGLGVNITYRLDTAYLEERGLLYLSIGDLTTVRDRLFDYQEFVESYAARPTLARLVEGLSQQLANAMALGLFDLGLDRRQDSDLRFLHAVLDGMLAALGGDAAYHSPWATAFSLGRLDDPDAGYFFSANRRFLFVFVEEAR
ncbi:MAG: hypothetical protein C5B48_04530, partial [Candidatus Rokuibacteriota bacterium]